MPGLMWRCGFSLLQVKEENLGISLAVAYLANICATKEKKDGS